jgi:hypothetical protein
VKLKIFTLAPFLEIKRFKIGKAKKNEKTRFKIFDLCRNYCSRSDGLYANILSLSTRFTF